MNIFALDIDPRKAAMYHCDKHVVKMILESAQILSTAIHELGGDTDGLYKPTHVNHPCSIWARDSYGNYSWLFQLYYFLSAEYIFRYGKIHKSSELTDLLNTKKHASLFQHRNMTRFALAMPDEYKTDMVIESYRNYYLGEKRSLLQYTNRETPWWVRYALNNEAAE